MPAQPVMPGRRLPDLVLANSAGEEIALSGMRGEATLLVFLRHLGCLPCRGHLVEVAGHRQQLPGRIVVVTFATPELLERFEAELELGLEMLADRDRALYAALGFGRGSVARVWLHPRVWLRYASLVANGARLRGAQGDTLQLGGDAVIDGEGRLSWIHRSEGPDDRPSLERLRRALVEASG